MEIIMFFFLWLFVEVPFGRLTMRWSLNCQHCAVCALASVTARVIHIACTPVVVLSLLFLCTCILKLNPFPSTSLFFYAFRSSLLSTHLWFYSSFSCALSGANAMSLLIWKIMEHSSSPRNCFVCCVRWKNVGNGISIRSVMQFVKSCVSSSDSSVLPVLLLVWPHHAKRQRHGRHSRDHDVMVDWLWRVFCCSAMSGQFPPALWQLCHGSCSRRGQLQQRQLRIAWPDVSSWRSRAFRSCDSRCSPVVLFFERGCVQLPSDKENLEGIWGSIPDQTNDPPPPYEAVVSRSNIAKFDCRLALQTCLLKKQRTWQRIRNGLSRASYLRGYLMLAVLRFGNRLEW